MGLPQSRISQDLFKAYQDQNARHAIQNLMGTKNSKSYFRVRSVGECLYITSSEAQSLEHGTLHFCLKSKNTPCCSLPTNNAVVQASPRLMKTFARSQSLHWYSNWSACMDLVYPFSQTSRFHYVVDARFDSRDNIGHHKVT